MQDGQNESLTERIRLLEKDNAALQLLLSNYNNFQKIASEQEQVADKWTNELAQISQALS